MAFLFPEDMKEDMKLSNWRRETDALTEGLSSQVPLLTTIFDPTLLNSLTALQCTLTGWHKCRILKAEHYSCT